MNYVSLRSASFYIICAYVIDLSVSRGSSVRLLGADAALSASVGLAVTYKAHPRQVFL